jgi:gliding motility-associated-like protein
MNRLIIFLISGLTFGAWETASSQTIIRSTLCSVGASATNTAGTLSYTFGQCPGCGSMTGANGYLNPGFQQPFSDTCFTASAEFSKNSGICGTTYDFLYTGDSQPGSTTYSWNFGQEGFPQVSNAANVFGVAFSSLGVKEIILEVRQGACIKKVKIVLNVDGLGFGVNPQVTSMSCPDSKDGAIKLFVNAGTPPYLYNWSNGASAETITGLAAGNYSYTVSDALGCKATNTVTMGVGPGGLMFDYEVKNETCDGDVDGEITLTVSGGVSPLTFKWSHGVSESALTNLASGTYTVTITDFSGCQIIRDIKVGQQCKPDIPDIFSPNGDGINDNWVIPGIDKYPNNYVRIFNRWGNIIYQKRGYMNEWQGTYSNGELLSIGAYYYIVHLNDENDTVLSGSITVVR